MKKLLVLFALVPTFAFGAASTWASATSRACSLNGTFSTSNCRSVVGTCAAGTTCDAPSAATDGILLDQVVSVHVVACAIAAQTITDGASLDVYIYDNDVGLWAKTEMTLTVPTGARCGYAKGDSPGFGIPILTEKGRLAIVPNAAATSSGALAIYIMAVGDKGQDL